MTITAITRSPEPCVEAGWTAFQYYLDAPVSRDMVTALAPLGTPLVLDSLRQPFFKIESHHYMLRGLLGDDSIRVAVHRDFLSEQEPIKQLIESL